MPTMIANQGIFIIASIIAAELWNNFGYISDWRQNKDNPNWKGLDKKAISHDLILGAILGIGVVVYQAVMQGTPQGFDLPNYIDFHAFAASVASLIPVVVIIDKVLVSGILGIDSRSAVNTTDQKPISASIVGQSKSLSVSDKVLTVEPSDKPQI